MQVRTYPNITCCIAAAVLAVVLILLLPAGKLFAQDEPAAYSGRLQFIWADVVADDHLQGSTLSTELFTEEGKQIPLEIGPELLSTSGVMLLQGTPVEIEGVAGAAGAVHVAKITVVAPHDGVKDASTAAPAYAPPPVLGSQPWILLLCRGEGAAVIHEDPVPFYNELLGNNPYGVDHFWRELSYGKINLAGSTSVGWFDLPKPAQEYEVDQGGMRSLDMAKVLPDCAAAADPTVDFTPYKGIIVVAPLQALQESSSYSAFGGTTSIKLDGNYRTMRVVMMPLELASDYQNYSTGVNVLLHEMGHGFGLPHSSGPYNSSYDSKWDLMSNSSPTSCYPGHTIGLYSCSGQHTIAAHKAWLGWLDADKILTVAENSASEVLLSRLAQPGGNGVLMIKAPIAGSGRYYTVEARQLVGYDEVLPAEAVIIHEVDESRTTRQARVVDSDGDGDPNDSGARWTPGERFDGEGGFTLCVKGRTPEGLIVVAGKNRQVDCTSTPDLSPSQYKTTALYPSAGQTVTVQIELANYRTPATNVVVTTTLPSATEYVTGTASTTQGVVHAAGTDQLVFEVGNVTYDKPIVLSYAVVVKSDVTDPAVITHSSTVVWDQGSTTLQMVMIANAVRLHLPVLMR